GVQTCALPIFGGSEADPAEMLDIGIGAGHGAHASGHAWADAYVEHLGWVSFDPSNRSGATEAYIRTATGLDYAEAGPIRGVRSGGGSETMTYSVMFPSQQ